MAAAASVRGRIVYPAISSWPQRPGFVAGTYAATEQWPEAASSCGLTCSHDQVQSPPPSLDYREVERIKVQKRAAVRREKSSEDMSLSRLLSPCRLHRAPERGRCFFWCHSSAAASGRTMESFFLVGEDSSPEERTFRNDSMLPSLPVPKMDNALSKYLDSCRAVLNDHEYNETKKIVEDLKLNQGTRFHNAMLKRSNEKRNWLDEWWHEGYMNIREPAALLNISGAPTFDHWPIDTSLQVKSAALQLHLLMKFWMILRKEVLKQQKDGMGNAFSMHQFRFIFNTCRIPHLPMDKIFNYFKTKYEGDCPSHVIVLHRQRLYKIQGLSPETGEIYSPSQFYKVLLQIVQDTDEGPGISALTELDRDKWADARSHLIKISSENDRYIHDIDTAILCFSLFDRNLADLDESLRYSVVESYGMRWMDKANFLCSANSKFLVNADHCPLDGMVIITIFMYMTAILQDVKRAGGVLSEKWEDDSLPVESPTELCFILDDKIKHCIADGFKVAKDIERNFDGCALNFDHFGKRSLQSFPKVHPLAFVQICMQLAYMRKHGKPAPTYETATTRLFYRGRTETVRSCTPEAVDFCRAVINDSPDKKALFLKACEKYMRLVKECKAAKGCDRYLLGLAAISNELGQNLPEIFTDNAYVKTGGNGNFTLSSSFLGYNSNSLGSTFPMKEDGYGIFYRIDDDSMMFSFSTNKSCLETCAKSFSEYFSSAMLDVHALLVNPRSSL